MNKPKTVAVIVAHPDDETLWCGGTILCHPTWNVFIISLSRADDTNRAPKFFEALKILGAEGNIGYMNDGAEQLPLDESYVQAAILYLLPHKYFDIIITHNPNGEYTKHLRHEEVSKAVIKLWHEGIISATQLWTFAYEDGGNKYYPKPMLYASVCLRLPNQIWTKKHNIITETYGFEKSGFEAQTTPKSESFLKFSNSYDAIQLLKKGEHIS
ncbi:MAG: LmbE family protein [uncultured bacterium]|nr:MAG: LmbE family protein [uncultured bacterium]HBY01371.1 PIG-L family deacetylase [Rikenellaceae bacterium]